MGTDGLFTVDDAVREYRAHLLDRLEDARDDAKTASGVAGMVEGQVQANAKQRAAQETLRVFIEDLVAEYGKNTTLDVRGTAPEASDMRRDYDKLVGLLQEAGYRVDVTNTTWNSATSAWEVPPGDAPETFITFERLGSVRDWVVDNVPAVPVASSEASRSAADEAAQLVSELEAELERLDSDPVGTLQASGRYESGDFATTDGSRAEFDRASESSRIPGGFGVSPAGGGAGTVPVPPASGEPDTVDPAAVIRLTSPNDVDEASQAGESPNLAEVQERFPTLTLSAQQMIAAGVDDGLYTMEEAQEAIDGFAGWATDGDLAEEGGPPGPAGSWEFDDDGDGADSDGGDDGGDPNGGEGDPLPAGFTDEDIANLAFGRGYGARFLAIRSGDPNNPDIGDVLLQAAAEGWYDSPVGIARLGIAIAMTPWAIARSRAQEQFEMLESTDPGEAEAQLDKKVAEIQRVINRLGLGAHTEITSRIRDMARDAIYESWTSYELNQNVLMEADWAEGQAGGAVGANYRAIDTKAADYMVGHLITDADRDGWAEDLYLGDIDEAWLNNHMADLAMQTWTGMADRIKQGYTVRQIVSPLRQEAGRWLERDITDRDFLDNPDFARILNDPVDDGGSRLMTVAEVGDYVRTLDEWQTTKNARRSARSLAEFIGKKFGRAA